MKAELSPERPVIWLASYPKSGNTWLRAMLTGLQHPGEPIDLTALDGGMNLLDRQALEDFAAISSSEFSALELVPYQAMLARALAQDVDPPFFAKTHAALIHDSAGRALFPPDITAGAIYCIRDPRDVAVSYAHHDDKDLDTIIDWMGNAQAGLDIWPNRASSNLPQLMTSWSKHVQSWTSDPGFPVLVVRYEDLLADTAGESQKVASFCGFDAKPGTIGAVVDATRFDALQAREAASGFPEKPSQQRAFFRAGRSGDGERLLSSSQIERLMRDHAGAMARFGYGTERGSGNSSDEDDR